MARVRHVAIFHVPFICGVVITHVSWTAEEMMRIPFYDHWTEADGGYSRPAHNFKFGRWELCLCSLGRRVRRVASDFGVVGELAEETTTAA